MYVFTQLQHPHSPRLLFPQLAFQYFSFCPLSNITHPVCTFTPPHLSYPANAVQPKAKKTPAFLELFHSFTPWNSSCVCLLSDEKKHP